ncbi:MAG: hypothetical protein KF878_06605 [Planctomycetes bacterium]|nr:hypothetical protein [Planctomycetota bacterium]
MTPTVTLRLAAALALLAAPALAQEGATYDLRQDYKYKAGDKVRVHERNETRQRYTVRQGDEVERGDGVEGYEWRYEEEVQEVDGRGRPVRAVRTYTFVHDLSADERLDLAAAPVKVQVSRDDDGLPRFAAVDGGAELPPLLERLLLEHDGGGAAGEGDADDTLKHVMPPAPVAVGARWPITREQICKVFPFDPDEIGDGADLHGTLVSAEPKGGLNMLTVALRIKLPLKSYSGMVCPEPMVFDATVTLRMPAGAGAPDGGATMDGTMRGKALLPDGGEMPADGSFELDLAVKSTKTVERVK